MLWPRLTTGSTDFQHDVVAGRRLKHQHPVTSPLHSPSSLSGVAVIGDGFVSPVHSSSASASSGPPWPTSPTERPRAAIQLDSWVRGSAENLVGQVCPNQRRTQEVANVAPNGCTV